VVIVNHGRVVGEGKPDELKQRAQQSAAVRVEGRGGRAAIESSLRSVPGLLTSSLVQPESGPPAEEGVFEFALSFEAADSGAAREAVFAAAVRDGWVLRAMSGHGVSLEDVFAKLTTVEKDEPAEVAAPTPPSSASEEVRP
jgi:ABC-type multidrug transport system ATPase subunit